MSLPTEEWRDGCLTALTVNNGDGTGTRTTYDAAGNVTSVEHLTDLPITDLPADPDLIPPDPTRLRSPR